MIVACAVAGQALRPRRRALPPCSRPALKKPAIQAKWWLQDAKGSRKKRDSTVPVSSRLPKKPIECLRPVRSIQQVCVCVEATVGITCAVCAATKNMSSVFPEGNLAEENCPPQARKPVAEHANPGIVGWIIVWVSHGQGPQKLLLQPLFQNMAKRQTE